MYLYGTVKSYDEVVSKRGNSYKTLNIIQDDNKDEYFNCIIDSSLDCDVKSLVGQQVSLDLDYNPKYRNFRITHISDI